MKKIIKLSALMASLIVGGAILASCGKESDNKSNDATSQVTSVVKSSENETSSETQNTSVQTSGEDNKTEPSSKTSESITESESKMTSEQSQSESKMTSEESQSQSESKMTSEQSQSESTDEKEYLTYTETYNVYKGMIKLNVNEGKIVDILYLTDNLYYYEPIYVNNEIVALRVYNFDNPQNLYTQLNLSLNMVGQYVTDYQGLRFKKDSDNKIYFSDSKDYASLF
ncbi:MAG: hypothetical protein K5892_05785, partial [Acholeplasmatales bacterium]|nr:hypothetical protein [Acholeplasmatales bacterium]